MIKNLSFLLILLLFSLSNLVFAQIPTNGLVGYWAFNGNAKDSSTNGNNGTVNGATLLLIDLGMLILLIVSMERIIP